MLYKYNITYKYKCKKTENIFDTLVTRQKFIDKMPSLPHPVKNVKINNFHLCLCLSLLYPLYFLSLPFIRWNIIFR